MVSLFIVLCIAGVSLCNLISSFQFNHEDCEENHFLDYNNSEIFGFFSFINRTSCLYKDGGNGVSTLSANYLRLSKSNFSTIIQHEEIAFNLWYRESDISYKSLIIKRSDGEVLTISTNYLRFKREGKMETQSTEIDEIGVININININKTMIELTVNGNRTFSIDHNIFQDLIDPNNELEIYIYNKFHLYQFNIYDFMLSNEEINSMYNNVFVKHPITISNKVLIGNSNSIFAFTLDYFFIYSTYNNSIYPENVNKLLLSTDNRYVSFIPNNKNINHISSVIIYRPKFILDKWEEIDNIKFQTVFYNRTIEFEVKVFFNETKRYGCYDEIIKMDYEQVEMIFMTTESMEDYNLKILNNPIGDLIIDDNISYKPIITDDIDYNVSNIYLDYIYYQLENKVNYSVSDICIKQILVKSPFKNKDIEVSTQQDEEVNITDRCTSEYEATYNIREFPKHGSVIISESSESYMITYKPDKGFYNYNYGLEVGNSEELIVYEARINDTVEICRYKIKVNNKKDKLILYRNPHKL